MAQPIANDDYDLRRAARHRADHNVIVESKIHGDQKIHIVNVSAQGFMTDDNEIFTRGDRIELRLPVVGRIEAHLIWSVEWKNERVGIVEMRRHYTNYFKGIHGFKEYKQKLVTTDGINQLLDVFTEIEQVYADYVFEG